jgi:hypothetical protein
MNAIGKAAGVEFKKDGIHVLTVCPGYVQTAFSQNVVLGNERKKVRPDSVRGITAERVARATLTGIREAEAGSDRALDDVCAAEDLSVVSGGGGVGDGQDGGMRDGLQEIFSQRAQGSGKPDFEQDIPAQPAWLPFRPGRGDCRCGGRRRCHR